MNGGCDVIVAWSTPETLAAMSATRAIPIVFLAVADPIGSGIVQSLAKPGGNVTGTTNFEPSLGSKWVDVLRDLAPGTARVAVLTNTANPAERRMQTAVEEAVAKYGMEVAVIAAERPDDLKKALDNFGGTPDGGVVVIPGIATNGSSTLIVDAAARLRLPAVYPFRFFTDAGGLASYGVGALELTRLARRAAAYVDRILHGASPTDLPVEGPTNFELVLNLTTAKRLGLTMSQAVLVAADEVIE